MAAQRHYLVIDLKSFYASVECVDRGLDPMTTKLVVADLTRTDKTICLAVSPAMKALGVRNRCRIFEIPAGMTYITAAPRMQRYIDVSAQIYGIYLQWVAKEDIHVYSIDEVFIDITGYLSLYQCTPRELGERIRKSVVRQTGIPASCGLGTNLYLAKIALDIMAKHRADFFGELDEQSYKIELWNHRPLTDFWRIGSGISHRLAKMGITCMGELALASQDPNQHEALYQEFGIDAEILVDHAWGIETVGMPQIKAYRPQGHSLSNGQVLAEGVDGRTGLILAKEMTERLTLDLVECQEVAHSFLVWVGFELNDEERRAVRHITSRGAVIGYGAHAGKTFVTPTDSRRNIVDALVEVWPQIAIAKRRIKRIGVELGGVEPAQSTGQQLSLFTNRAVEERERCRQKTINSIKQKYGKNAMLKAMDLLPEANARERNMQIGGHRAGL